MPPRRRPASREPRRAIALIRVSKVGAREETLLSPDLQRASIEQYAEQRDLQVVEWVEALDESGSSARSPWWRRLDRAVEQIEDGDADAILVWKFSRAARNRRRWAIALDRVEVAGGVLESATEQLDTTTSTGRLARGMLAELAAWESEVKSEQWREVHESRRARGVPHSSRPRFGYVYGGRAEGFVPDPAVAPAVVELYAKYLDGVGMPTLCHWLNDQGLLTTRGSAWLPTRLGRWMDAGFAAGYLPRDPSGKYGDEEPIRGAHQPLIDPETWVRFQRERLRRAGGPRERADAHWLSGLPRCALCGGRMTRQPRWSNANPPVRVHFYQCLTAKETRRKGCTGTTMSASRLEAALKAWVGTLAHEVDARAAAVAKAKARRATARREVKRADSELARIDGALARLTEQFALGEVPPAAYRTVRDKLTTERAALVASVADQAYEAATPASPAVARSLLGSWEELAERDPAGLRSVLGALVARVEVSPGEGTAWPSARVVPRWEA